MKKAVAFATGAAMFLSAAPAFASHWSSSDIDVDVTNKDTTVVNEISTGAFTGGNTADGGSASTRVRDSGNISGFGNDDNQTGGGDVDSDGGNGGTVTTGNADSESSVRNNVNSTTVKVKTECGCKGDIDVDVKNKRTTVGNGVGTMSDTGANYTDGGSATTKVKDSGNISGFGNDGNTTGGGNTDSDGGDGGDVTTGDAWAKSKVTNTVNSTVVRVRRI